MAKFTGLVLTLMAQMGLVADLGIMALIIRLTQVLKVEYLRALTVILMSVPSGVFPSNLQVTP
jgi:hypothetical protein